MEALSLVAEELEWRVERYGHFDVELCREAMDVTVAKLALRKKSTLMLPMRHALTGVKVSTVPETEIDQLPGWSQCAPHPERPWSGQVVGATTSWEGICFCSWACMK